MNALYMFDEEYRMFQDIIGDAIDAFLDDPASFSYPESVGETKRVLSKLADHARLNMRDFGSESQADFLLDLIREEERQGVT